MKKIASVSMVVILMMSIVLYIQVHNFVPAQTQENEILQDSCSDIAEKDRDSRTENLEADESIPDSAGEMTDGDDSYVLSEEEKKVLLTYAKYLQKFYEEYPYETDGIKYDLVFIDIDNIPELAIIPLSAHPDGVYIYVYDDGAVVETGEFGSRGWCKFKPYGNLICSDFFNMGEGFSSLYRIEGTESVELQTFRFWEIYRVDQYIETGYEVDGVEVSEEEFHEAWEKWNVDEMTLWGYDDAILMEGIDDFYRELCRRISLTKE